MSSSRGPVVQRSPGDIIKQGCLKKLKTNKKKYFVLRGDHGDTGACLEYYDNEKRFKANQPPKRSITLKTCFNINKRTDTKHKFVIALYTKDCFCVVFENEDEMEDWLKTLLELQLGQSLPEGEPVRPTFEHVWCVTVLAKDLGWRKNILGPFLLCLTDTTISLVRATNQASEPLDFPLQTIRRCGHTNTFFYIELGQLAITGAGSLWMQTEDGNIAENMHTTIYNACCSVSKKDGSTLPPSKNRPRNSPSSDSLLSKQAALRSSHSGVTSSLSLGGSHQRTYSFPLSPVPPARRASTGTRPVPNRSITSQFWLSSRDRSDSMPSRPRTTSEGLTPHLMTSSIRPQSMYNKCVSYSPPINSSPVSPASVTCSTDSAGSSLSMDGDTVDGQWEEPSRYGPSLTPDEPVIPEEDVDRDYALWPGMDEKLNNYMQMEPSLSLSIQNSHTRKHSLSFKSASPSQGSGMDMYSPLDSSPMSTPGNYMPMSPGENRYRSVTSHSRDSSLTDDAYVPMSWNDDGYVDMDHNNKQGSCNSITSRHQSSDIRFSEYPLDKVSTYFSPDEDLNERPARAYSVGSRPNPNINSRSDLVSTQNCERVRAFSLGSQNVRRFCRLPVSSSHSSMEPSDDMMELDFSKKGKKKARKKANSSERLSVPGGSVSTLSSTSSYSTAGDGSYTEMSPPRRFFGKSPPKSSPPHLGRVPEEVRVTSPPIKPALLSSTRDDYLDMSLKRKISSSEDNNNRLIPTARDDYVEMSLGSSAKSQGNEEYMIMSAPQGKRRGSQPIAIRPVQQEKQELFGACSPGGWGGKSAPREQGIFPFSPDGGESRVVPGGGGGGDIKEEEEPAIDRLISGLGTMTIVTPNDKPSSPPKGKKELHYASLDLTRSGSESEESGKTVKVSGEDSSSSASPSLQTDSTPSPPFNYAEIDFGKSAASSR